MEHDGESGELFHNGVKYLECQWGRNEAAFCVACALLGSEFVCAVACADRDGQRIAACTGSEVDDFLRVGVCVVVTGNFVLNAGQYAKFTFNSNVILVSVVYDLFCKGYVFLVGKVDDIDHY